MLDQYLSLKIVFKEYYPYGRMIYRYKVYVCVWCGPMSEISHQILLSLSRPGKSMQCCIKDRCYFISMEVLLLFCKIRTKCYCSAALPADTNSYSDCTYYAILFIRTTQKICVVLISEHKSIAMPKVALKSGQASIFCTQAL